MNQNELRIDNWVNFYHSISGETKPTKIWPEWFCNVADQNDSSPIPITPEILKKAGFKNTKTNFRIYFSEIKEKVEGYNFFKERYYLIFKRNHVKIEYVHQLQNLYFALTGEELTIEL